MGVSLIACCFAGSAFIAGNISGALLRQPEINKLRMQVKDLQKSNSKLLKLIAEQQRQIEILDYDFKMMQFHQFSEKRKNRALRREEMVFLYAYYEYLNILYAKITEESEIDENANKFFILFESFFENHSKESEKEMIKKYILSKYGKKIMRGEKPQIEQCIEKCKRAA